jgi:hypothetical protein
MRGFFAGTDGMMTANWGESGLYDKPTGEGKLIERALTTSSPHSRLDQLHALPAIQDHVGEAPRLAKAHCPEGPPVQCA